jgi:glucose/arabinose dehydrogenase
MKHSWGMALSLYVALSFGQSASILVNPENQPPKDGALSTPYRVEVLARGLHVPWSIVVLPDHRVLFTERTGAVRVLRQDKLLSAPALTNVALGNKMGMLGMAAPLSSRRTTTSTSRTTTAAAVQSQRPAVSPSPRPLPRTKRQADRA